MLAKVVHKIGKKIPQIRRTHCFGLGAAKTGTTTLASMFEECYRSAHEPEAGRLTVAAEKVIRNTWSGPQVVSWLMDRDKRLNLEVEASHPLGYMATWLPEVFPRARFIITIREPLPWLKSRLNYHYYKDPPEWKEYRDAIWKPWHREYCREEKLLEDMGLYSLDAYLAQYSEQYKLLFRHLPEDRRLVIKTTELNASVEKIACFLQVNPDTVTPRHANGFAPEQSVIDYLSENFVARRIAANCQWMEEYL